MLVTTAFKSSGLLYLLRLGVSVPSLHRESIDSLIYVCSNICTGNDGKQPTTKDVGGVTHAVIGQIIYDVVGI